MQKSHDEASYIPPEIDEQSADSRTQVLDVAWLCCHDRRCANGKSSVRRVVDDHVVGDLRKVSSSLVSRLSSELAHLMNHRRLFSNDIHQFSHRPQKGFPAQWLSITITKYTTIGPDDVAGPLERVNDLAQRSGGLFRRLRGDNIRYQSHTIQMVPLVGRNRGV